MNIDTNNTQTSSVESMIIKDIVLNNFKAANVMEKYGIDFCCKGKRPLYEALAEKQVDPEKFFEELNQTMVNPSQGDERYEDWDLTFLANYIVNNHHSYIKKNVPVITAHLEKIAVKHGRKYEYLNNVLNEFDSLGNELINHMLKEERILFPLIKYLEDTKRFNEKPKTDGYGTVKNPIKKMENEHSSAGTGLENIRALTRDFTLPEDACTTFKLAYKELEEFEKDLHKHVHLENNILFPKAIELEEELLKK
jgi:regulator of cell morphogenesis and NO signaling